MRLPCSFRRIITGIVFFSWTVVAAVGGYMVAGWNFLDAIYVTTPKVLLQAGSIG
jgi:voltage-gated potassium channel